VVELRSLLAKHKTESVAEATVRLNQQQQVGWHVGLQVRRITFGELVGPHEGLQVQGVMLRGAQECVSRKYRVLVGHKLLVPSRCCQAVADANQECDGYCQRLLPVSAAVVVVVMRIMMMILVVLVVAC